MQHNRRRARKTNLRARITVFPHIFAGTCAQIHFARMYDMILAPFESYLRADSVCAQVRKFNEYISIITPEGCDNNRLDICPNDLDEWLHFSHNY